jgi:F0F1-type ATP synthase membrane subunit a
MYAGEMIFILLACFTLGLGAPAASTPTNLGALVGGAVLMVLTVFLFARSKPLLALLLLLGIPLAGVLALVPSALAGGYTQIALATAWTLFHILIISLQAYIFMTLTVVYMAMAADHH